MRRVVAKHPNHYVTLGVSPSATTQQIKKAYRNLARKHHPDKNIGNESAAALFNAVKVAFEQLSTETVREALDTQLRKAAERSAREGKRGEQRREMIERLQKREAAAAARPHADAFRPAATTSKEGDAVKRVRAETSRFVEEVSLAAAAGNRRKRARAAPGGSGGGGSAPRATASARSSAVLRVSANPPGRALPTAAALRAALAPFGAIEHVHDLRPAAAAAVVFFVLPDGAAAAARACDRKQISGLRLAPIDAPPDVTLPAAALAASDAVEARLEAAWKPRTRSAQVRASAKRGGVPPGEAAVLAALAKAAAL